MWVVTGMRSVAATCRPRRGHEGRGRALLAVLAVCAVLVLDACGSTTSLPAAPAAHSAAERQWIANANNFIGQLNSDVLLSTVGGANLATARRALHDQSDVYSMLVAYDLFGDCNSALASVGTPSVRAGGIDGTLITVCGKLEDASTLFGQAMAKSNPTSLLRATKLVITVVPMLTEARSQLASLRKA
jgi:hypothetical protein